MGWLSNIFGKKRRAPIKVDAAANPAGVAAADLKPSDMPTIDSVAVEEARKKAALLAASRGGRESTMFTDKGL